MSASGDSHNDLLDFIVAQGGATVAQLAATLPLADATIRRHLDRLAADGLIRDRSVRQATGRPYRHYQATNDGVRASRDRSESLALRLIGQITSDRGRLDGVAEGLADQLAAEHRSQVPADAPLEQRVAQTVEALREEGILDAWQRTPGGFRLHNHACPYRSVADSSDCVCESDRLAIEKLVGADVVQVGSLVHGNDTCEYRISAPAPQPSTPQTPATQTPATQTKAGRTDPGPNAGGPAGP